MEHAVDPDARHGGAGDARQERAAQGVAEGVAESGFEGLDDEPAPVVGDDLLGRGRDAVRSALTSSSRRHPLFDADVCRGLPRRAHRLCLRRTHPACAGTRLAPGRKPETGPNPTQKAGLPDAGLSRPARHTCRPAREPRACEPGFSGKVSPREAGPTFRAGFSEQKVSPREASGLRAGFSEQKVSPREAGPGLPGWIPGTEGQHPRS